MASHKKRASSIFAAAIFMIASAAFAAAQTPEAVRAQPKDASPPRTGSISGHVLIDNKAAANVEVAAYDSEGVNRRIPAAQARTDSEGYYHLTGLTASNYQVASFTPSMVAAENGTQSASNLPYFAVSKNVLLAPGEDVTEIDLKLARGGVITGRITDADDKPIVEERVSIQFVSENGQPAPRFPAQFGSLSLTDDRGIYRIYGLPSGRYRVSVGQPAAGIVTSDTGFYVLTYYPDATDLTRASLIDVIAGAEVSNIDIKIKRRAETRSIAGRVVDAENGLPLSGVRVGLQIVRDQGQGYATSTSGTTTADGAFTISGVSTGRYGVYLQTDDGRSDFYSDPVIVNVAEEDVSGIQIKALRGANISGTVVPENMELKELLRQLPGLRVSANVWSGTDGRITPSTLHSTGSALVRPDGSFTITGLRPGRAWLSIDARDPGSRPSSLRPSLVKITARDVVATQGFDIDRESVSGVQLLVAYGTGVVSGALNVQGGSLADYRVEVRCSRQAERSFGSIAYADSRGHFTIKGLAPGIYECGVQLVLIQRPQGPVPRPPQIPRQTVTVSNGVESEITFLIDLTPKGVGP